MTELEGRPIEPEAVAREQPDGTDTAQVGALADFERTYQHLARGSGDNNGSVGVEKRVVVVAGRHASRRDPDRGLPPHAGEVSQPDFSPEVIGHVALLEEMR
ncbi:MAG: hypothetical protein DMF92_22570, partial [Acidobacteria bacterium]